MKFVYALIGVMGILAAIVLDDESREYYYPNQEALDESQKNGWVVISMKNDFKVIFS